MRSLVSARAGGVAGVEGAGVPVGGAGEGVGYLQDPRAGAGRLVLGGGHQEARRERGHGGGRTFGRLEGKWFSKVRTALGRKELQDIGARMLEARASTPTRPRPSTFKKAADAFLA
ncbi:hypothetical protein [Kitasatospora herbaricolor]|uniref:hypothetical protein n=1 Tax=Kitasatospora herbaricolor TaxID=68217 RepID=UPI0036D96370